jgi:hypothetical protein
MQLLQLFTILLVYMSMCQHPIPNRIQVTVSFRFQFKVNFVQTIFVNLITGQTITIGPLDHEYKPLVVYQC